jgi:hypothetical protein
MGSNSLVIGSPGYRCFCVHFHVGQRWFLHAFQKLHYKDPCDKCIQLLTLNIYILCLLFLHFISYLFFIIVAGKLQKTLYYMYWEA